jgi:alkylation response protein AidB-like acyl-CoA dehydrogenase
MRASLVGRVDFDEMPVGDEALIGKSGDYLREPHFSAGAWRTSAVTLGGLEALLTAARRELVKRGRDSDAHQRARMGEGLIAQETARLWVREAAMRAEGTVEASMGEIVAYVNLARIAVETATLDAVRLVQRSLGLAAFLQPNPVERLMRDLGTYLRQPAPDDVLTEAAAWFMAANVESLETAQ